MSDEKSSIPIGGPQPIEPSKANALFKRFAAVVGVSVGGALAFAILVAPTSVRGVTRSARIRWQQRRNVAPEPVSAATSSQTNAAVTGARVQPPVPRSQ